MGKSFMSKREQILKKKLIELLRDDGKGHHHAKYARCLEPFDINIVPLGKQPETAAISFDTGTIYINEGFLVDPATFYQLNTIIRHELCHNLLMHQIRMIKHLEDRFPKEHLTTSKSLHNILNILEDFEISNLKYSDYDKNIVRNTWLNGKLISGLVTEDHMANWANKSLEDMFDDFSKLVDRDSAWYTRPTLKQAVAELRQYRTESTNPTDYDSAEDFYKSIKQIFGNKPIPDILENIFTALKDLNANVQQKDKLVSDTLAALGASSPVQPTDIINPETGEVCITVYTPEEKLVAQELLKIYGGFDNSKQEYNTWYNELTKAAKKYNLTEAELADLLGVLP